MGVILNYEHNDDDWQDCPVCYGEGMIDDPFLGYPVRCFVCDGDGGWPMDASEAA